MEFYKTLTQRSGIQTILQKIKEQGPISKRELQEVTGLSWGHISQVSKRFLEEGYIVVKEQELTAGRTRDLLDINPDDNYIIGIDLNSQRMRIVLVDMKGHVVYQNRIIWMKQEKEVVLNTIFREVDGIMHQYCEKKILGIGFAVQGIVDILGGISVKIGSIENWNQVPLKDIMTERYGIDVILAHDPDCLMKSECSFGVLKNSDILDAITVNYNYGLGVGMSIMINGHIYVGAQGKAGELGHTILNVKDNGWHDMLVQHINKKDDKIDMQKLGNYIGQSIAIVNSILNPEIIVMHIAEPDYKEVIFACVEYYLKEYSYNQNVSLKLSKLDRNVKAIGAALMVIDEQIDKII